MAELGKTRTKWTLFTIALKLPAEESMEAAEMRGYNWLARRLTGKRGSGQDIELISFKSVPISEEQFRPVEPSGEDLVPGRVYGYVVRLRGVIAPGNTAPDWIGEALISGNQEEPVRFLGITAARPALLTGRP